MVFLARSATAMAAGAAAAPWKPKYSPTSFVALTVLATAIARVSPLTGLSGATASAGGWTTISLDGAGS